MRSQIVKRVNINLTQKEIESLEYIKTCNLENTRYTESDIIRDAINMYAETMGLQNYKRTWPGRPVQFCNIYPWVFLGKC